MAKQVQFRRGTTDEHRAFTGRPGEVTVDTEARELVVHDGATPGGFRAARKPFGTTAELLASREGSRGVGEGWVAGEHRYDEAARDAADHHVATAGGVRLYQVDASPDVTALGAADRADPGGRQTFAPALISSMRDRRLRGVTLRDLVGRNYSDRHDAAAVLSGFITELAPAGIAVHDPDDLSLLCEEPIRIQSGLKLHLGLNTTLMRGFADGSSDTGALLSRADWSVDTDDLTLHAGVLTTASPAQTGKLMAIYGAGWEIKGTRFLDFHDGQAIVFGGDDNRITDCLFRSPTDAPGTGAVRMVGGSRFRGLGLHAFTGDDLFQFVPITDSRNARYDLSIEDSHYVGCHGISRSARVMIAALAGPQDEAAMSATIRRVGWIGCSGSGGNRTFVVENTEGDGRVPRQIDDVVVSDCSLDGSRQNGSTTQDVLIHGAFDGAIGRVTLSNSTVLGTARKHGVAIRSPGSEVVLDNLHVQARGSAVFVGAPSRLIIRDGRYAVVDHGGPIEAHHVLDVGAEAGASHVLLGGRPAFEGVAEGKAAIRLSSGEASLDAARMEARPTAGAGGTLAVSHGPGAAVLLGEVLGDVDAHEHGAGSVRREPRIGAGPALSITSGTLTLTHASHVVDGPGTLDGVVFPDWAGDGQVFTLRARDGGPPVVVRGGGGNVACAEDRTLAGALDVFVGVKLGDHLVEIGFANLSGRS